MVRSLSDDEAFLENIVLAEFHYSSGLAKKDEIHRGTCFLVSETKKAPSGHRVQTGKSYLVTNRHCVDWFTFQDTNPRKLRLVEIRVFRRWRRADKSIVWWPFKVVEGSKIFVHPNQFNDIALIEENLEAIGDPPLPVMVRGNFTEDRLADNEMVNQLGLSDTVYYIGFPGNLWDHQNQLPIIREAHIASIPALNYSSKNDKEAERILVSGMSFAGSSGSPVFFKAINGFLVPIGFMSGHYGFQNSANQLQWATDALTSDEPEISKPTQVVSHAGLSYFIKSSVVHRIRENGSVLTWGGKWDHATGEWT